MAFITVLNALRQYLYFKLIHWCMTRESSWFSGTAVRWENPYTSVMLCFDYTTLTFHTYDFRHVDINWRRSEVDWACYV